MPSRAVSQFSSHGLWNNNQACPDCQCIWESNHGALVSKQAFKIKCNVTIEVWVWENSSPLKAASQIQLLAGEDRGEASRQRVEPHYQEAVRKESLSCTLTLTLQHMPRLFSDQGLHTLSNFI